MSDSCIIFSFSSGQISVLTIILKGLYFDAALFLPPSLPTSHFLHAVSDDVDFQLVSDTGAEAQGMGRLRVHYNGMWGRVCGEEFGWNEALAVCKYLNFQSVQQLSTRYVNLAMTIPCANSKALLIFFLLYNYIESLLVARLCI